ncbi:MAG: hypothetical protein K0M56_00380 [Kaistella sp.]|nr:hypothetical protein [Kaistella sp.]
MKKILFSVFLVGALLSCHQEIKPDYEVVAPQYLHSSDSFENRFKNADSVKVGYEYAYKNSLISNSESNNLMVSLYYNNEVAFDDDSINRIAQQVKTNAQREIVNIKEFQLIKVEIVNKNKTVMTEDVALN